MPAQGVTVAREGATSAVVRDVICGLISTNSVLNVPKRGYRSLGRKGVLYLMSTVPEGGRYTRVDPESTPSLSYPRPFRALEQPYSVDGETAPPPRSGG